MTLFLFPPPRSQAPAFRTEIPSVYFSRANRNNFPISSSSQQRVCPALGPSSPPTLKEKVLLCKRGNKHCGVAAPQT